MVSGQLTIANGSGSIESALRNYSSEVTISLITLEVAALTTAFPQDFPSDPVDRIIAATARAEEGALVTADERIRNSPLARTMW